MKIKQMSKILLPDEITIKVESNPNTITSGDESEEHKFEHVRVQISNSIKNQSMGDNVQSKKNQSASLVFIDAINSVNVDDYEIQLNDVVVTDEGSFKVVKIDDLKTFNGVIHHWELTLE